MSTITLITEKQLRELYAVGGKIPCPATMIKRRRAGLAPKPRVVGKNNLYRLDEAIKYRNKFFGIEDETAQTTTE